MKYGLKIPACLAIILLLCHANLQGEPTIVEDETIDTGEVLDVINDDEISTSGTVRIIDGGDSVFWSANRVRLLPGFEASPNTDGFFQAAIDADLDGHTDLEESRDVDQDGILDGYEYQILDHDQNDSFDYITDANGVVDLVATLQQVEGSDDFDGDGVSNSNEIAQGTDLTFSDNPAVDLNVFFARG